jgi:hypothetical protein
MPKYVIERELPGAGKLSQDELRALSQRSVNVLHSLGPTIQWIHAYVADNTRSAAGSPPTASPRSVR